MRKLLPLLLLLLLAGPAWGRTLLVRPVYPNDTTKCTTTGCALDAANRTARPGDIVHLGGGTYTIPPNPVNHGTTSNYIEYRGVTTDYDSTVFNYFQDAYTTNHLNHSYTKYRSMKFLSSFYFCQDAAVTTANKLQINGMLADRIHVIGNVALMGCKTSSFDSCVVDSFTGVPRLTNYFWITRSSITYSGTGSNNNVVSNNTMHLNTGTVGTDWVGGAWMLFGWPDDAGNNSSQGPDSGTVFTNNNVTITLNSLAYSTVGNVRATYFAQMGKDTISYNTFVVNDFTGSIDHGQRCVVLRLRDWAYGNYFYKNDWTFNGDCQQCQMTSQGSNNLGCSPNATGQRVADNTWDSNTFRMLGATSPDGPPLSWGYGICNDIIRNNIFISTTAPIIAAISVTGATIDHNTFVSTDKTKPLFQIDLDDTYSNLPAGAFLNLTNNIFYTNATGSPSGTGAGMQLSLLDNRPYINSRNNLFFHRPFTTSAGDRDISWVECPTVANCGGYQYSEPGQAGPGSWYARSGGQDSDSRHGAVGLIDSTITLATFDGRFLGNQTYGMFGTDGYVGARAYRKLYTFRPIKYDTLSTLLSTYSPGTWASSGTVKQHVFQNANQGIFGDSLSNPRVYMSDSLAAIRVYETTKFINNAAIPFTAVTESLSWRESPTRNTNTKAARLYKSMLPYQAFGDTFTTQLSTDSSGAAFNWNRAQFLTNYGTYITSTWSSQPATNSFLTVSTLPSLEVWGWPRQANEIISPGFSKTTYDPCTSTYSIESSGNDSTTISNTDSVAYYLDPINNNNRRPTVEVIAYNPGAIFNRAWFDGAVGTNQDSAIVLYRNVPADRFTTFTSFYSLPTTSNLYYHILRTRTIDGNGDWRRNNWSIGQPIIGRTVGGGEGTYVRTQKDATSSASLSINTAANWGSPLTTSTAPTMMLVVISVANGSQSITAMTWGGLTATFGGRHSGGNFVVEYWYINNPTLGSSVTWATTFSTTVDATFYCLTTTAPNPSNLFSATGFNSETSSGPTTLALNGTCGTRVAVIHASNTATGQPSVFTPSTDETVSDVGFVGITGPEVFSLSFLTASASTSISHTITGSDTWILSAAILSK